MDHSRLIWRLLTLSPHHRISAADALKHEYFTGSISMNVTSWEYPLNGALVSQVTEPKLSDGSMEELNFTCPKCGKTFTDFNSCTQHARSRKHANFCTYDNNMLPPCLSSHAMLPIHPTSGKFLIDIIQRNILKETNQQLFLFSGYCDIQGRRPTIEDFHTVVLESDHQFYGVFDGHNGNLASKYAASSLYEIISEKLGYLNHQFADNWKDRIEIDMISAFDKLHTDFTEVAAASPGGVMGKSGTTVTMLYMTSNHFIIANVGDSRAVLSKGASYDMRSDNASVTQLTVDHIPSNELEKERIEGLGGVIKRGGGIERVEGTLAITRSIGDTHLTKFLSHTPFVLALHKDEVKQMCRADDEIHNDTTPCFVVLASDGLWDVISSEESIMMVVEVFHRFGSENEDALQEAAQKLTHEAYVRGSRDNIGVCVVAIT